MNTLTRKTASPTNSVEFTTSFGIERGKVSDKIASIGASLVSQIEETLFQEQKSLLESLSGKQVSSFESWLDQFQNVNSEDSFLGRAKKLYNSEGRAVLKKLMDSKFVRPEHKEYLLKQAIVYALSGHSFNCEREHAHIFAGLIAEITAATYLEREMPVFSVRKTEVSAEGFSVRTPFKAFPITLQEKKIDLIYELEPNVFVSALSKGLAYEAAKSGDWLAHLAKGDRFFSRIV